MMSEEEKRARAHPIKELKDLYKGFISRREWLALLTGRFRIRFESLLSENQQLKDEVKRLNKVIEKYSDEAREREEQERLDYLIEQEEVFNDYSFMEE